MSWSGTPPISVDWSSNCIILMLVTFGYCLIQSLIHCLKMFLALYAIIDTVIGQDSSFIICRFHIFTSVSSVYLFNINHYYFCFCLFAQERLSFLYMCTVPDKLSIIILLTVWFYQVTYAFRSIYTL